MRRLPWLLILLGQAWWLAQAASKVVFNPASPEGGPFPTDYLTVPDASQKTGLRVNLPFPDCVTYSSTCDEIALLNQLDGFNPLPRVSVRFSTPINPDTVAEGVFLVWLDDLTDEEYGLGKKYDVMTINQVIYDPASYTAYAKPDGFLDQHRRYLLVATNAVHGVDGAPVEADPAFTACVTQPANDYCHKLAQALGALPAEIAQRHIVGASVFTTLSATAWLEKARATLPSMPLGFQRTGLKSVFDISRIALLTWRQQTAVNPAKFRDISFP